MHRHGKFILFLSILISHGAFASVLSCSSNSAEYPCSNTSCTPPQMPTKPYPTIPISTTTNNQGVSLDNIQFSDRQVQLYAGVVSSPHGNSVNINVFDMTNGIGSNSTGPQSANLSINFMPPGKNDIEVISLQCHIVN
jgi:hypothetical protein